MSRKPPKFEALVVNAIRRLQSAQGSTANEIASYLNQEYDVSGPEIRKQIQMTIRRGLNYGILQKSKRGYTTCDRNIPDVDPKDEDCYECRVKRRRGGDKILSRHARMKKRGGRSMGGGHRARSSARSGRTRSAARKRAARSAKTKRRGAGMGRKSRSVRRHDSKPRSRRVTANALEKAKQKKQSAPDDPPTTASNTSTNRGRSTSKSPIRNESETNPDS